MISPVKNENNNFTKARLQQVLDYCERSFVEQIGGGFTSQLETVLGNLKVLSQEANRYEEKQFYNEIYFTLLNARSDMSVDFKLHLKKYFKERIKLQLASNDVNVKASDFRTKKSKDFSELSIVSDSEENKLISERSLEKHLDEKLGEELVALSMRVESILGENINPFSPDILAKALSATLEKIIVDNNAQTHVIKAFGTVWPEHIKTTYQGINNYLVANDVIPDMKLYLTKHNIRKKEITNLEKENNDNKSGYQSNDAYYGQNTSIANLPNLPRFSNSLGENLNMPPLPVFKQNISSSSLDINIPSLSSFGQESSASNKNNISNRNDLNPPTIPGFEHFAPIDYYKVNLPKQEDFRINEDVDEYKVYESDTPEQKEAKWENVKEIISSKFHKLIGRVKSTTSIKDALIRTESQVNSLTLPPGYTSTPAYQQKPSSYHKLMSDAVIAQREAIHNGGIFHIPDGLTKEELDAHSSLLVSKENSIMLNDLAIIQSFAHYQKDFLSMSIDNSVAIDKEYGTSMILNPHRNVLSEIAKASVQNYKMDPNETMIVDLLSLVFDKIFNHQNLPEHIKYLVSKLQIPILKTSLLDKTFFIYRDNPVRLFLDCLGTHETLYNLEYHSKFEKLIDNLLGKTEILQDDFSLALEKIQIMLKEYSTKENIFINKVSNPIKLEERAVNNYDYVLNYMEKITKRTNYKPIISFIDNIWSKAFADKWTLEDSQDKDDFMDNLSLPAKINLNQSLLVFEMIIWSTEVKLKTTESRNKLKLYIPKIADGLKSITKELDIGDDDYDKLSVLLAKQQLDFLSDKQDKTEVEKNEIIREEKTAINQFAEKVEPMRKLKAATKDIVKAKSDFDEVFISGRWFEFNHDKSKMRLVWVSPQKTMYLFNNPEKKKVYKFDKSRVWSYYRSSHIKIISNENNSFGTEKIIDEAVNGEEQNIKDFAL